MGAHLGYVISCREREPGPNRKQSTMSTYPTTITTMQTLDSDSDVVTVPAVRLWDVYQQAWQTYPVRSVPDQVLASLPATDRELIAAATA